MSKPNGCGPSWLHSKVKDILFNWWFEGLCNEHDKAYDLGGMERERRKADQDFFNGMVNSALTLRKWQIPLALFQAILFYIGVRLFGWIRFNYMR